MAHTKNESGLGLGAISQYAILKFIMEEKPDQKQVVMFVNENFSRLVARVGDSKYNYITEVLVEKNLIKYQDARYIILSDGISEFNYLHKNIPNLDKLIKSYIFKF